MTRPNLNEAMESVRARCEYALTLATEAYRTADCEDENGKADPIHAYADSVVANTLPVAVIGLFLHLAALSTNGNADEGGER